MNTPFAVAVTSGPAAEPILLAAAKAHLVLEHDEDDELVSRWLKIARELVEAEADYRLVTQTVAVTLGGFPCGEEPLLLPVRPVSSVSSISYRRASDGAETALTGFQPWLARLPAAVYPPAGECWPAVDCRYKPTVTVTCVCGAAREAVPGIATEAILLTLGYWNGFRGDGKDPAAAESIPGEAGLPAGAVRLINTLRGVR